MKAVDIVVVGAGIAGASLAWRVADARSVVVLEREGQPGMHATGRSAAMFMETYGPPGVRALTRASRAFYEQPPAGFCNSALLRRRGALYVAEPGQEAMLDATEAELLGHGGQIERLDAAATVARVPCLRPECVCGALFEPAAEDIDVHALHQGFLAGLRRRGGQLRTDTWAETVQRDEEGWTLTLNGGETLRAGLVVNAAGAWADEVAARFGVAPLGIEPRRRSAFTFAVPPGLDASDWPVVAGVDEGWYFKPDAGRLLGSPANADPAPPHDVRPEELDIALGIDRLQRVTTLEIRRPESTWAGLRSFAPDGELVIGPDPTVPGFFWLAGQGGYGIQSAAGASALAAALLLHETLPASLSGQGVDPAAFAPSRLR